MPELLALGRGMFRLDQLAVIAREKVASRNFVDEIEVYLAYQVKLREQLALPLDTPDMRFFNVSYVTQDDLDVAQARVMAAEQQGFADYLATAWQPWQSVLQRLEPQAYAAANEALIEAMGEPFAHRLQARLQALGIENDADAERIVGAQVRAEIEREIKGQLTRDFLARQGLRDQLPPG
jgi:hypothetical protein